jgi:hypothetical protein
MEEKENVNKISQSANLITKQRFVRCATKMPSILMWIYLTNSANSRSRSNHISLSLNPG